MQVQDMKISAEKMAELVNTFSRSADDVTWNRFSSIPWSDLQPELLTEDQRSAVSFITFIEDHLPGYFAEYNKVFSINEETSLEDCVHNREFYHFLVRWAQEEDRHAHVLANYCVKAELAQDEQLRVNLAVEGRKRFLIDSLEPPQIFAYALLQEKATQLYYLQFRDAVTEPVLKFILLRLAKDEARHFAFFASVIGAYLEEFGEQVIPHIKESLHNFKMPLYNTLTNYWRWSLVVRDAAGGYDHAAAHRELFRVVDKFAASQVHSRTHGMADFLQELTAI
jgi:acyl-[acyl-carrier-protein] desaturase